MLDLDRQLILTKDNITVNIDTCVYYRIIDPRVATYRIANIVMSVAEVTYATLRTICGENSLQDLLEKRQEIADTIEEYVYEKVDKWGRLCVMQESLLSRSSLRTCRSTGTSRRTSP